jgi:DNA processing protein
MSTNLFYCIALSLIDGIGNTRSKQLILSFKSDFDALFSASKKKLLEVENIGPVLADNFIQQREKALEKALKIQEQAKNDQIHIIPYWSEDYPKHLKFCNDHPLILYFKGSSLSLLNQRMLAIVGTRNSTSYGKKITEQIISDLEGLNIVVVSGLAYGIDGIAHQKALQLQIPTLGVLAHGLDTIYPKSHFNMAEAMVQCGGLLTEYPYGTTPDRERFPARNRIVAGLCEATLVIEAAKKGGALITAQMADGYHRDVFAVPGRLDDLYSEGCNWLIREHKAHAFHSIKEVFQSLRWQLEASTAPVIQHNLFLELNAEEQAIYNLLQTGEQHIDAICHTLNQSISSVLIHLFSLEMNGVVVARPGKVYALA